MIFDLTTPILFLVFNRPETTQRVFDVIRSVKPSQLFVAADGARYNKPGEAEKCNMARDIVKQVDWPCQVHTLFRSKNLGCRLAVSSAINWFFEQVEEGIILEDDCLPDQSFFWFCQELLTAYREDNRVMHISGSNYQYGQMRGEATYYFSRLAHIWGWATWRRAWKQYDVNIQSFPKFVKENKIADVFEDKDVQQQWLYNLNKIYQGVDTWDYQWAFANIINDSYCIIPNANLVTNIGFGSNSTHASDKDDKLANIPLQSIDQIIHPLYFVYDKEADNYTGTTIYKPTPFLKRLKNKVVKTVQKI